MMKMITDWLAAGLKLIRFLAHMDLDRARQKYQYPDLPDLWCTKYGCLEAMSKCLEN